MEYVRINFNVPVDEVGEGRGFGRFEQPSGRQFSIIVAYQPLGNAWGEAPWQPYSAARQSDGTSEPVNAEAGSHRGSVLSLIAQLINRGRPDGDNALLGLEAIQTIILLPGTAFGGGPRRGSRPATQAAIDQLLVKTFSAEDLEGPLWHDQCLVCHDSFEAGSVCMSMPCDHTFHSTCLTPWLDMHSTCPVCRREIECADDPDEGELHGFQLTSLFTGPRSLQRAPDASPAAGDDTPLAEPTTDQPHAEASSIDADSPQSPQADDQVPAGSPVEEADDQAAAATPDVVSEPCTPEVSRAAWPGAATLASGDTAVDEASSADGDDEGEDSASDDGIAVETRKRRRSRSASIVEGARRVCASAVRSFTSAL